MRPAGGETGSKPGDTMEHNGVVDSLSTRPSLLMRIRDSQDALAWNEFVGIYGPLIYAFARKHGLQDADAADLTQEVLRAVVRAPSRSSSTTPTEVVFAAGCLP